MRVPAEALRRVMSARLGAGELLLRYASGALIQGAHASACHAHHTIEQRLARWLSSARDRLEEADILVTHDQLARMLGVRRAGITVALHVLEGEGLLRSTRGRVAVRDEVRLRAAACGCYAAARAAQDGTSPRVGAEPWGRADATDGAMTCEAVAQAL